MSNNNDNRILELRKIIGKKKKEQGKSVKFNPVTNCSIEFQGNRYNIQVLGKSDLIDLIVQLNALLISAKDLEVENEYAISGYTLDKWISDIQSRLDVLKHKEEEKKLKLLEEKLSGLLSTGKQVELEIDEIESLIKGE